MKVPILTGKYFVFQSWHDNKQGMWNRGYVICISAIYMRATLLNIVIYLQHNRNIIILLLFLLWRIALNNTQWHLGKLQMDIQWMVAVIHKAAKVINFKTKSSQTIATIYQWVRCIDAWCPKETGVRRGHSRSISGLYLICPVLLKINLA